MCELCNVAAMTAVCFTSDPPEIEVEKSVVYSGEGFAAKLVCFVFADPPAEVRRRQVMGLQFHTLIRDQHLYNIYIYIYITYIQEFWFDITSKLHMN